MHFRLRLVADPDVLPGLKRSWSSAPNWWEGDQAEIGGTPIAIDQIPVARAATLYPTARYRAEDPLDIYLLLDIQLSTLREIPIQLF